MKQETVPKEHQATVRGRDLDISTKFATEISNNIRNKSIKTAKQILSDVISQKRPISFRRYNRDLGHKAGLSSARYPIKASKVILKLLEELQANSEFKELLLTYQFYFFFPLKFFQLFSPGTDTFPFGVIIQDLTAAFFLP